MKIRLIILFLLPVTFAAAQTVKWDSTYRPGSYELKVEQFKSYRHSTSDIVFLGNSITAGTDWHELLNLPQAKNRGISGDITFGVLERLDEVINGHPAKVFILIGINDISRNIPDDVIINNYQRMVSRIKTGSPKTKIYFQTVLPVNNTFTQYPNHYNKDEHIAAVNEGLKKIAAKEHITLIDLHSHFLDSEGRLSSEYTREGLHLNAAGYQVWAKVLQPYLK
ncbi:sialate O-acetylesterase [Pedobacter sp. BS3]|uniref:GDSL-type esterase/lipase family protein n=1 Tax=Pedobacter sp. BS3 TaxID=2567937 RepID=UPI0011ECE15A|nr:GDSL-type esterase/lipase family protein [Pedobacter sp. BS3]TZF82532.1 sialate O-acetylesterase [Pedobacter sp. BS3]